MKKAILMGLILVGASLNAHAVEVYDQPFGCVQWTKSEALQHFGAHHNTPCENYNYATWFEGGAGTYKARVLDLYDVIYGLDPQLGRAWIEIRKDSVPDQSPGLAKFVINTGWYHVPGLSFQSADGKSMNGKILYNGAVIAEVTPGFLGLGYNIKKGGVRPQLSIVDKTTDDGFNWIYITPHAVVTLDIP